MNSLESQGSPGLALLILRQQEIRASVTERDAVAAALVDFVVSQGDDKSRFDAVTSVINVLVASAVAEAPGVPYAGATAALAKLARLAGYGYNVHALAGFVQVGDEVAVADTLEAIARSELAIAPMAVRLISDSRHPLVRRKLQDLCGGPRLPVPQAESSLRRTARGQQLNEGRCRVGSP